MPDEVTRLLAGVVQSQVFESHQSGSVSRVEPDYQVEWVEDLPLVRAFRQRVVTDLSSRTNLASKPFRNGGY